MNETLIKSLEEYYSVKIEIKPPKYFGHPLYIGEASMEDGEIYNNKKIEHLKSKFLCAILHEIGHIHCYRNKIFKHYHTEKYLSDITNREKRLFCATGLKAERYCDKFASKELLKWSRRTKYPFSYSTNVRGIKTYKKHYLSKYKPESKT